MLKIGIIFGGRSREREISFAGGRTVYDNLDKTLFEAVPIFADSFGNFILLDWQYLYKGSIRDFYPAVQHLPSSPHNFQIYADSLSLSVAEQHDLAHSIGKVIAPQELSQYIDFAFLTLHGVQGEDGTIQGLLQYWNIPYTASGIFPSAFGMDKAMQRKLMKAAAFQVPNFILVKRQEWLQQNKTEKTAFWAYLCDYIGMPMVIKPANQGSSIGATILTTATADAFCHAIDHAFFIQHLSAEHWNNLEESHRIQFVRDLVDIRSGLGLPIEVSDSTHTSLIHHPETLLHHLNQHFASHEPTTLLLSATNSEHEVIVESFLEGKEFSCIVLRTEQGKAVALPPTEIRKGKELFDYRSKYLAGLSSKITPIDLPTEQINDIRHECERLFNYFRFNTYARIDGFITEHGIFLNDPNTTSGMLPSSFFFHQAAEIGLNPSQFLTYIICSSLQERQQNATIDRHVYTRMIQRLEEQLEHSRKKMEQKKRVGVILGGYSSERHISVESGRNIYEKLSSSNEYQPIPIFLTGNDAHYDLYEIPINILLKDNADDIREKIAHFEVHPVVEQIREELQDIMQKYGSRNMVLAPRFIPIPLLSQKVEAVFIALHGRPGEDGSLQRHLDQQHLPYNGSSADTSHITIDKYATNQLLSEHGLRTARQFMVYKKEWEQNQREVVEQIEKRFSYPFIAKPSDDGCSSAVKKIHHWASLLAYTNMVFREADDDLLIAAVTQELGLKPKEEFPQKDYFLIEELIEKGEAQHFLEVTGGLLTHRKADGELAYEMFEPSETLASGEVLSLEEKFLAGEGQNITPARYSKDPQRQHEISEKVKQELRKVAVLLNIEGYCRIDAFVKIMPDESIQIYIIEVNSLPGMTPATCIFHQCSINGYTPFQFIHAILQYGMKQMQP